MRVRIIAPGDEHVGIDPAARGDSHDPHPATYGRWRPEAVLGAESAGGLRLPSARPTEAQMYAPRGVCLTDDQLIVADTGNHRVLLWNRVPKSSGAPADVVLGQPDAHSEGPSGGLYGMHLPTGVLVHDRKLVVADAWNHRILVWHDVPDRPGIPPDVILGQLWPEDVEPNRGAAPTASSFYWPFGIAVVDGRFYVADTGNRRVLCWFDGIPASPTKPADLVLGQPDPASREENRGRPASADSFRWPHSITSDHAGGVLVADAGNHRVLRWPAHPAADGPADSVLGQPDLSTAVEFPYRPQEPTRFRFPYAAATGEGRLAVADTANNRVLVWDTVPIDCDTWPDHVLGQRTFVANGENRWEQITDDTLCWPYGVSLAGDRIAIADSGNNRVVLWGLTA